MTVTPAIFAAFIAAVAALVVALVGLLPNVGRLHRLEQVVGILEKVEEPEAREPLLALRNRLIERLRPRGLASGALVTVSVVLLVLGTVIAGAGLALNIGGDAATGATLSYLGAALSVAGVIPQTAPRCA